MAPMSIHCQKHSTTATKRRTPHADENEQWGFPIIKKVCMFACQLTWVLTTCERPSNHISTALSSIGRAGSLDVLVYIFIYPASGKHPICLWCLYLQEGVFSDFGFEKSIFECLWLWRGIFSFDFFISDIFLNSAVSLWRISSFVSL